MTIDFKDSEMSSKNKSTLKKFENLVINDGDVGLRKISKTLNEKVIKNFKVTNSEFKKSEAMLDGDLKEAILIAYTNIYQYHEKQLPGLSISEMETTKGIKLWSEFKPIDSVGYIFQVVQLRFSVHY